MSPWIRVRLRGGVPRGCPNLFFAPGSRRKSLLRGYRKIPHFAAHVSAILECGNYRFLTAETELVSHRNLAERD